MLFRIGPIVAFLLCVGSAFGAAAPDSSLPPLPITFTAGLVHVASASPGGDVVIFGYSRRFEAYNTHLTRSQAIITAKADGTADLAPSRTERWSVWCAVDVTTGRYGLTDGDGRLLDLQPFSADSLKNTNNGQLEKLELAAPYLYLVLVRPGVGAWELSNGDGGINDDDHAPNGKVTSLVSRFSPLSKTTEVPRNFRKSDLLVAVDVQHMLFYGTRVKE